ncbi:MAG: hypothetical protein R3Y51_04480, partial [Rikenellaceae bacterium]
MKTNKFIAILAISIFSINSLSAQKSLPDEPKSPWSMERLSQTPSYEVVSEENGVQGIIYKSVDYKGHSKDVFAYYATPGTLSGDKSLDKNLPAVVCVHGGKGRAFD